MISLDDYKYIKDNKVSITNQVLNGVCDIRGCEGCIMGIIKRKGEYRLVCSYHYGKVTFREVVATMGLCRICKEVKPGVLEGECHTCYTDRMHAEGLYTDGD